MKFRFPVFFFTLLTLISGCTDSEPQTTPTIDVLSPYIRELIPGKDTTAAFMDITNNGPKTCHLTGGKAAIADRIELHQHSHHQGVMQMRKIASQPIKSGETLTLTPGGYHLMVFGISSLLKKNSEVTLILTFSDCPEITTRAKVKTLFDE